MYCAENVIQVWGNCLRFNGQDYVCAIGKGGLSHDKHEGDGATPIGTYNLRECWYRLDRLPPPETGLPLKIIHENDGWCDDTKSVDYNKYIKIISRHPRAGGDLGQRKSLEIPAQGGDDRCSYENLWHDDHLYDLIIPLGYNDDPIVLFSCMWQNPITAPPKAAWRWLWMIYWRFCRA